MRNSSFSFKKQQTTAVTDSDASSRTGPPSKPPIKPVKVPEGKVSFLLNLSSYIDNSSGYLKVKSMTPTLNSRHIAVVLALPVGKEVSCASSDSSVSPEEVSDPDKDKLIIFKVTTHSVRQSQLQSGFSVAGSTSLSGARVEVDGQSGAGGKSVPASAKLLIHQLITFDSLYQLHQLKLAERFPQSVAVAITVPSCWSELALTQHQRRYSVFQSGPGGFVYESSSGTSSDSNSPDGSSSGMGGDGLYGHIARVLRIQQDKFSWDHHCFKISLPPRAGSLAHVHLRFVLSPFCTVPPEFQVFIILN